MNKVETMVEGYLDLNHTAALSQEQKTVLRLKLGSRVSREGFLQVRSQVHRSQLSNKAEVIRKMNELIRQALKKDKRRISTGPTAASRTRRIESKKKTAVHKQNRQKIRHHEF